MELRIRWGEDRWPVCAPHSMRPCLQGCVLERPSNRPLKDAERSFLATKGFNMEGVAPWQTLRS